MTLQTDIDTAAAQLKDKTPQEVLTWALGNYDKISLASSFGAEDVTLIDMIAKSNPTQMYSHSIQVDWMQKPMK